MAALVSALTPGATKRRRRLRPPPGAPPVESSVQVAAGRAEVVPAATAAEADDPGARLQERLVETLHDVVGRQGRRNRLEGPARQDVETLEGPPAAAHRADPQVAKPGDEPSLIDFHAAAQALVRRFAAQLKGDVGAAAAVAGQRVTDRPAAERVAVHQDDVVAIGQEVAQIDDGSQGSQQLRLDGEAQLDSPFRRLRLQSIPDGPRQVVQVDCRLAAGAVEDVDRTHRHRAAGHGQ